MNRVHSAGQGTGSIPTVREVLFSSRPLKTGWEPGGVHVQAALRGLTKAERRHVENGCISGDFRESTIRSLQRKAMFFLFIDAPNGRAGFMRLTPLGENVRALIKERAAKRQAAQVSA